jgi:arsenate reductase (glutaredoxin)
MSEDEAITLLSNHGNLVKRPFVVDADWGTSGFNEAEWKAKFD